MDLQWDHVPEMTKPVSQIILSSKKPFLFSYALYSIYNSKMSQQQQQQDSRFVMPTEMIMTPKLMDLFKNIDDLMNDYVVNAG